METIYVIVIVADSLFYSYSFETLKKLFYSVYSIYDGCLN